MLNIKIIFSILSPILIYAGSFERYNDKDVTYDPGTNLIYIGINEVNKKDKIGYAIVNYMVISPDNGSKFFVFPKDNQKKINTIFFETMYDSTGKRMVFNMQDEYQHVLR